MKIIFTKGRNTFSNFISWGLEEPVSHIAFVFDDKLVFHSNFLGCHVEWYETFKKNNDIIFEIDYKFKLQQEEDFYQTIITNNDGRVYDYGAFLYFAWRVLLRKMFKIALPLINKLNNPHRDLCIEVLKRFNIHLLVKDLSMVSPYQVYLILKGQNEAK